MSIREYVGARYVPIFGRKDETSIEWDNTKPYEPLTIVIYEGNSYTSRQYVPADIDIHNQLYWALTGNYNAQVEAYRREVYAYNDRITAVEDAVDDFDENIEQMQQAIDDFGDEIERLEQEIANPGLMMVDTPINDGTACLVRCDDNAKILIDCGISSSANALTNFLTSSLGTAKLDAFIISHFHPDHVGGSFDDLYNPSNVRGLDAALAFCDENTDIYMQMTPTGGISSGEMNAYNFYLNELMSRCANLGLKTPVTPVNGEVHEYNGVKVKMLNTNPAYQANYHGKSDNGYSNTAVSLNNFSIITYVTYQGNVYANLADIETPAQYANYADMDAATLAQVPHHARNYMGYCQMFDKLNTSTWHYTKSGSTDSDLNSAIVTNYLFRYVTQIRPLEVWTNRSMAFSCDMVSGDITHIEGYRQYFRDLVSNNLPHNANSYLPPANVSTMTPWEWWDDQHITDILRVSSEFDKVITCRMNGDVPYEATCPAYDEMLDVFDFSLENTAHSQSNSVVFFELGTYPLRISIANPFLPFTSYEIWNGFDVSAFPATNWRIVDKTVSMARNVTGLAWNENESLNNAEMNRLLRNDHCLIRVNIASLNTSINVPVFKTAYHSDTQHYEWRGVAPIATAGFVTVYIHGEIGSAKTLGQARYIQVTNNTTTACTVVAALSPYSL